MQHSGFEDSWVPAQRASASFLAQAGTLTGLHGLQRGLTLDLTPEVTSRLDGGRQANGGWDYDRAGPELVGPCAGESPTICRSTPRRIRISRRSSPMCRRSNSTPRDALFFPENEAPLLPRRPGAVPDSVQLVYTRRVVQPVGALKLTGKAFGTDVGVITAVDDPIASATGEDQRMGERGAGTEGRRVTLSTGGGLHRPNRRRQLESGRGR